MLRRLALIAGIAVLHGLFTIGLLLAMGGRIMAAFEGEQTSTWLNLAGLVVVALLMMPLTPLSLFVPSDWEKAVPLLRNGFFYLNSLLWGLIISWYVQRRPTRRGV